MTLAFWILIGIAAYVLLVLFVVMPFCRSAGEADDHADQIYENLLKNPPQLPSMDMKTPVNQSSVFDDHHWAIVSDDALETSRK